MLKCICIHVHVRRVISQDFSWFQDFFLQISLCVKVSWKKRSSHQVKKEVACTMSKPLVSCLCGCGESVNPPKLNIQKVQGALSSTPNGDPGPLPIFQDFVKSHHWFWAGNLNSMPFSVSESGNSKTNYYNNIFTIYVLAKQKLSPFSWWIALTDFSGFVYFCQITPLTYLYVYIPDLIYIIAEYMYL